MFTETVIVAVEAHWPAFGVKVYVVVALLFTAGLHVPEMPLFETVGKVNVPPWHMAGTWVKVGVTPLVTFTVIVVKTAHSPALGINTYVVVAVLFTAGLQVPLIPLFEVVGNVNVPPWQIGAIWVNVGVTLLFTTTVIEALIAH